MAAYVNTLKPIPLTFATVRSNFLRTQLKAATIPQVASFPCQIQQSRAQSKHYDPKWKKLRAAKVLKIDLPKFVELKQDKDPDPDNKTPDEMRMEMKKQGRVPPRLEQVLPLDISCTRGVIEQYKPKEGDGRQTDILTSGIGDSFSKVKDVGKGLKHMRRLKKYEDFVESEFAKQAQDIVIETHHLLQDVYKNQERLHELVTEKAFPEMVHGLERKWMRWQFVESVEPPKVVQVRSEEMITEDNVFAQVTVRMHTKQILAIYDRFGRLMFGDPQLAKSVVEYYVMEKWVSDTYGTWRIHGKIVSQGAPSASSLLKTYKLHKYTPAPPAAKGAKEGKQEQEVSSPDPSGQGPQLALA